jgi:hypothetical protein
MRILRRCVFLNDGSTVTISAIVVNTQLTSNMVTVHHLNTEPFYGHNNANNSTTKIFSKIIPLQIQKKEKKSLKYSRLFLK